MDTQHGRLLHFLIFFGKVKGALVLFLAEICPAQRLVHVVLLGKADLGVLSDEHTAPFGRRGGLARVAAAAAVHRSQR